MFRQLIDSSAADAKMAEGESSACKEADLDASAPDDSVAAALSVVGARSDLDLDEMLDGLDRLRHESGPTPLITLPELDS